jgi:hypothetical protein
MMKETSLARNAVLALAAFASIGIVSCSNIFGEYDNEVDPNAHGHQGSPIVISSDTTLSADATWNGQVAIAGKVTIPSGVTLTIAPGTVLVVAAGNNYTISISSGGTLNATGTADNPIVFRSDTSARTSWNGLHQYGTLKLEYCVIQDADYGLFIEGSSNSIEHCYFNNCDIGIVCFDRLGTCMHNSFESCSAGIWDFSGYYGSSNTNSVAYCIFTDNNWQGIEILNSNTTVNVSYSIFLSNSMDLAIYSISTESTHYSNSVINSTHCYPASLSTTIGSYNQNCFINVTNGETIPISTAGCGFNYLEYRRSTSRPPRGLALETASASAEKAACDEAMRSIGREHPCPIAVQQKRE